MRSVNVFFVLSTDAANLISVDFRSVRSRLFDFLAKEMLAALVLLVRSWRRNPDDGPGLLPVGVYRFGSVLALLSFSATGCIQRPSTEDGSQYLLLANGSTGSSSEGGSGSNSSTMSVLGAFYFISTHNGSTDIVTNSDGVAVARFLYEPFGKVNSDLTDLDPDRNGIHYGETFMFTGQEFEPETGLYNYKARIYDPETGRFLQPDPKHTERAGFDNWDRYQYANNNPVNFTDPTGESWLSKQTRLHVNMGRFWDTTFGRKGISGWFGARLSVNGWLKPLIKKQILKERNTAATQKFLVTYLVGISQGDDPQEVLKKAVEGFITTYIQMTVMAEFASKYFGDKYGSQINKVFTDSLGLGMVLGLAFGPVLGVAAGTSYGVYGLYKVFKNARREMSDIERAQRCGEASSLQPGAFPNGANVYVACR